MTTTIEGSAGIDKVSEDAVTSPAGLVGAEGSISLGNGVILKWGITPGIETSGEPVVFATPFPNNIHCVTLGLVSSPNGASCRMTSSPTVTGIPDILCESQSGSNIASPVFWQAIGD